MTTIKNPSPKKIAQYMKNRKTAVVTLSIHKETYKEFLKICDAELLNRSKIVSNLIGQWVMLKGTQKN